MNGFQKKYEETKAEVFSSKIACVFDAVKKTLGSRPLVLYGAGETTVAFLDYCAERDLPVACICDSHKTGVYGENSIPIINMQTLTHDFPDATVIVCSYTYNDEICAHLKQNGFMPDRILEYPINGPYLESTRTFMRCVDGYSWAYHFFKDERSRQVVLNRMRMYLLGEPMSPNTCCALYYEDEFISLAENEIFVDAGAWIGNSVEIFIERVRKAAKNYRRIYAFEPNSINYEKAAERLSGYADVEIIQKGLWSTETELPFFENSAQRGSTSHTLGGGSIFRKPVTSLDIFFQGKPNNELPTFIKMDIEGSEKEAILGAADIIRHRKPKLAICAYHKPEDIYELPQTILSIRDDYKLVLRQHEPIGYYDTVLYAN